MLAETHCDVVIMGGGQPTGGSPDDLPLPAPSG